MYGDDFLAHYGILGMKWGVRRTEAQLGNNSSKTASSKPKTKSLSEMSDDELRARLNRFDMEKRYKQYLAEMNPKKESRAKTIALRILENGLVTLGNKAFERIGQNFLARSETDSISKLKYDDYSKIGDKQLKKMAERAENLKKVKSVVD